MAGGFRELVVWKRAMDLVVEVYKAAATFPPDERFGLVSQVRRSAVSVPANIAEGCGRGGNSFLVHLNIANGSLLETETHLEVALRLGYLSEPRAKDLFSAIESVAKPLTGLRKSLER